MGPCSLLRRGRPKRDTSRENFFQRCARGLSRRLRRAAAAAASRARARGRPCGASPATSQSAHRTPRRSSAARSGRPGPDADRESARAPRAPGSAARSAASCTARRRRADRRPRFPPRPSPPSGTRRSNVASAGLRPCSARRRSWMRETKRSSRVLRRWSLSEEAQPPTARLRHELERRLAVAVLQVLEAQPVAMRGQQHPARGLRDQRHLLGLVESRPARSGSPPGCRPELARDSRSRVESGRHVGMSLPSTARPPLR